jgi:hypothetical protein
MVLQQQVDSFFEAEASLQTKHNNSVIFIFLIDTKNKNTSEIREQEH